MVTTEQKQQMKANLDAGRLMLTLKEKHIALKRDRAILFRRQALEMLDDAENNKGLTSMVAADLNLGAAFDLNEAEALENEATMLELDLPTLRMMVEQAQQHYNTLSVGLHIPGIESPGLDRSRGKR